MVYKYGALTGVGPSESTGIRGSEDLQDQGSLGAEAGLQRLKIKWCHSSLSLMFYFSSFTPLSLQHFYRRVFAHTNVRPAFTSGSETFKETHAFTSHLYSGSVQ